MSLDSNTTGLNEILTMAKNLPNAGEGGEAIQTGSKVAYVDCDCDMSTFTVTNLSATYDEIVAMVEAGNYVVVRGTYAFISAPVNVVYFPLSAYVPENNQLLFTGMINSILNGQNVLLSLSAFLFADDRLSVKARIVSVTDIN